MHQPVIDSIFVAKQHESQVISHWLFIEINRVTCRKNRTRRTAVNKIVCFKISTYCGDHYIKIKHELFKKYRNSWYIRYSDNKVDSTLNDKIEEA